MNAQMAIKNMDAIGKQILNDTSPYANEVI